MFTIDEFVKDCLDAGRSEGEHAGVAIKEVVDRAVSDASSIEAALGPPADLPSFQVWFNSDELTVLHVVWPPSVDLMPHDHRMWAAIGLYGGREDNRYYRVLPGGDLEQRGGTTLMAKDSVLLGDDTVHAVANPSSEWTGAIHVYGGDYFVPGRRLWLDAGEPPVAFDADRVRQVLEDAAIRARAATTIQ